MIEATPLEVGIVVFMNLALLVLLGFPEGKRIKNKPKVEVQQ